MARALDGLRWAAQWPYDARAFSRLDREDDTAFYAEPRLVRHIDDAALRALTSYYSSVFPQQQDFSALDLCSSWLSHYPLQPSRLAVLGMNEQELRSNRQATEICVRDLNVDPRLPYGDAEFDVVTNVVSVDYLTRPLEVYREVARVLRPGGLATVAFSNRCFITKVVAVWSSGDEEDRAEIVANYFHFAGGFGDAEVLDLSPAPGRSDPLYVVSALREA